MTFGKKGVKESVSEPGYLCVFNICLHGRGAGQTKLASTLSHRSEARKQLRGIGALLPVSATQD